MENVKMFAIFLNFSFLYATMGFCPETCQCSDGDIGTEIDCNGRNHWRRKTLFPTNTTKLEIHHSDVSVDLLEVLLENLVNLKNLTLDDTGIEKMTRKLFFSLERLEVLQLLHCSAISEIEHGLFDNLKGLRTFRITENTRVPFDTMAESLIKIDAPSLTTIIMDKQGPDSSSERPELSSQFYRLFRNKSVETLVLSNDFIEAGRPGYTSFFGELKCIIMQGNLITKQWSALFEMVTLAQLRFADGSHQGRVVHNPNTPDLNTICVEPLPLSTEVWELDEKILEDNKKLMDERCTIIFGLSPNARYIFISDLSPGLVETPFITNCFFPDNRIRYVDASHNPLDYTGHSIGLLRLQYYNVQHNRIKRLRYHTFAHYPSLTTLLLGGNKLGASFAAGNATHALHNLEHLVTLDLALNDISNISKVDFQFMMGIRDVNLSDNSIRSENLEYDLNLEFNFLHLAKNKLTVIPKQFQTSLDRRFSKQKTPVPIVDLSNNNFLCACENLEFIRWIEEKQKYFHNFQSYTCARNSKIVKINRELIDSLTESCQISKIPFIAGTVITLTMLISIVAFAYRYKNQLNYYLIFRPYLRWKRYTLRPHGYKQFFDDTDVDVFIVHSLLDREFVSDKVKGELQRRGLKVCISEDDAAGGELIVDYILSAVDACRCTLVVVSENLASSTWCNYEILMSLAMRKTVIVLSLDNLPTRRMPPALIHLNKRTRHIYPTKDEEGIHLRFWDKVAATLKDKMKTTLL